MSYLFGNRSNSNRELHKIYLRAIDNPGLSIEGEIVKLADGDSEFADDLYNKYCAKYGVPAQAASTEGYIYFLKAEGFYGIFSPIFGRYKIGLSNNVQRRLKELNGQQAPCPIKLLHYIEVNNMNQVETKLHKQYKPSRKHGEWFDFFVWELPLVWLQYQHFARASKRNMIKPISIEVFRAGLVIGLLLILGTGAFSTASQQRQAPQPIHKTR